MYRTTSLATLKLLGFAALALPFALTVSMHNGFPTLLLQARADSSIILEIPDHPGPSAAGKREEAEPEAPKELFIAGAINAQLKEAGFGKGQHADDVAALTEFYAARKGPALWLDSAGFNARGEAMLKAIRQADQWGLDPTEFIVPPEGYAPKNAKDQAGTELAISLAALRYARAARGGLIEPKKISPVFGQSPNTVPPADVIKKLASASAPEKVVLDLHPRHEQFSRLRKALAAAKSEQEDVLLRRNMDRWRWMPAELGAAHVWLNIPQFTLRAVEDGKTVQTEKVLVGGTGSPTPVLSANMTEVVVNPERVVPLYAVRRDILPKLKGSGSFFGSGSTAILDQYGIVVKKGGKTVDPKTINWKTASLSGLTFVQKPGRTNIMGKVQFLYPNDRKVFLGDTTLRGRFARDMRAEGGKEPRVDNASKLAERILAFSNGLSASSVKQKIASGKTGSIELKKPIPVHMTYFTAVVDETGVVKTFADVYKLDALPAKADEASTPPKKPDEASTRGEAPLPARKPVYGSLAPAPR